MIIHDVFGDISYKGEGLFIAGGAGITPFISIFRPLKRTGRIGDNKLLFANKNGSDIIFRDYFSKILKGNFLNILSEEILPGREQGYITKEIIQKFNSPSLSYYYLCGPDAMIEAGTEGLQLLGVPNAPIIREQFWPHLDI